MTACGHPSDQQLIANFHRHQADLERLITMFKADKGLGRVGDSFTRPNHPDIVGVTPERIAEYRKLCAVVAARDCIEGYDATFDRLYEASGHGEDKDPIWIH